MALEHFDVIIVGAGLSGVGAACHLHDDCPGKSYVVLEQRDAVGGTWDLFRYPGIRSDSDMYTLGYAFKPWPHANAIADGPTILNYVRQTAREYGVDQKIRLRHKVVNARWSSPEAKWTVECENPGGTAQLTCSFLYLCSGYYNYAGGYTPPFPGVEKFRGTLLHPQKWPETLDYAGKKVVVIGSGATAVTLVPAMTDKAAHVTMLQRSPTYIVSLPAQDWFANLMRRILPPMWAYTLARWKNVLRQQLFYWIAKRWPEVMKGLVRAGLRKELGREFPIRPHFTPSYNPWDQRLCLVPDADLFRVLRAGKASVVTDHIETFTENGLKLKSGQSLEADIVVSATGLELLAFGGMKLAVDGKPFDISKALSYRGLMLSDLPNLAYTVGYTNASWTLKADLVANYVCRLLNHMDKHGYTQCVPRCTDPTITPEPLIDFSSGYVQRAIQNFPKQGSRMPWKLYQNYLRDIFLMRHSRLDDGALHFGGQRP